jgi:hypothetical protein
MLAISEPLLTLYPRAKDVVERQLSQAFQTITDQEFRDTKNRICLFKALIPLLEKQPMKLDKEDCVPILEAVLKGDVDQAKENAKGSNASGEGGDKRNKTTLGYIGSTVKALFVRKNDMETKWDDLFGRATAAARRITDSQFTTQLGEDLERFAQYDLLPPLADKAKERAFAHLEVCITTTTNKLMPEVHRIQEQDCTQRIKREEANRAEEELCKLRVDLIRQLNNLSAHTAHTQVLPIFRSNEC